MDKEKKFEQMYDILADYENKIHEKNQKRIKIGLRCIWIIPLIFLILLLWTGSSKVIFLILWIVSLFGIAIYLILVEYADYKLQEKLKELKCEEDAQVESLLAADLTGVETKILTVIEKLDESLNAEEELCTKSEESVEKETVKKETGKKKERKKRKKKEVMDVEEHI